MAPNTSMPQPATAACPFDEAELTCDALTSTFRIWQRRRGHRFSFDDLATAWVAATAHPSPMTAIDLGCGVGSVLLMLASRFEGCRLFGIEVQEGSTALALRNVAHNGVGNRVTVIHGDLREVTRSWPHGRADLVTGTPPYLPLGTALPSPDPQRAAARLELRGGIEDYLASASRVLAEGGRVVVCADGRFPQRVVKGARAAELVPLTRLDVWPRAGAANPLFGVWTLAHAAEAPGDLTERDVFLRDAQGARTEAARSMRWEFGLDTGGGPE